MAHVRLVGPKHRAILVHKDAVVRSSGNSVVFRVTSHLENGSQVTRVVPVEIVEGIIAGTFVEVISAKSPLEPGDLVVTDGAERVRPRQEVRLLNGIIRTTHNSKRPKSARRLAPSTSGINLVRKDSHK